MLDAIRAAYRRPGEPTFADVVRLAKEIEARCTCAARPAGLGPLEGHEPDCSLQNTGWLS